MAGLVWQGVGERQEKPIRLDNLGDQLGSMEPFINGTALADFERRMAEVMPRVKADAERMSDAELAALASKS